MAQVRVHEIRRVEGRVTEARTSQVYSREYHAVQVRTIEDDGNLRIFVSPAIPRAGLHTYQKRLDHRRHQIVYA